MRCVTAVVQVYNNKPLDTSIKGDINEVVVTELGSMSPGAQHECE